MPRQQNSTLTVSFCGFLSIHSVTYINFLHRIPSCSTPVPRGGKYRLEARESGSSSTAGKRRLYAIVALFFYEWASWVGRTLGSPPISKPTGHHEDIGTLPTQYLLARPAAKRDRLNRFIARLATTINDQVRARLPIASSTPPANTSSPGMLQHCDLVRSLTAEGVTACSAITVTALRKSKGGQSSRHGQS